MTNDTAGASARAPRGSSGLPAGITKARKRYQARLSYVPTGSTKKEMRPIGTFDTVDEAVAALAEAQTKYAEGGEAAVWQKEKEQRAPRGSVRITCPHIPAHCWHTLREPPHPVSLSQHFNILHVHFTSASRALHTHFTHFTKLHENLNFSQYFTHTSRASHLLQHCSAVVEGVR